MHGRIWKTKEPVWISDVSKDKNFPLNKLVKNYGVKGAICFPIFVKNELVAVFEFFAKLEKEPNDQMLLTMKLVGDQIGRVFERKGTANKLKIAKETAEDANKSKSIFLAKI